MKAHLSLRDHSGDVPGSGLDPDAPQDQLTSQLKMSPVRPCEGDNEDELYALRACDDGEGNNGCSDPKVERKKSRHILCVRCVDQERCF